MLFADVILPLALPKTYTYSIPEHLQNLIHIGQRVVVPFAGKKLYSAIAYKIHQAAPENYEVKNIESILDIEPLVNEKQFALWEWMSEYYMCSIGEVMNAALPSALKLSSETNLVFNAEFGNDFSSLNDDEYLIAEALQNQQSLTIHDVCEILERIKVYPVINSMIEKKALFVEEELKEKFKPKIEQYVRLKESLLDENELKKIFDKLENAPKQLELLMVYVQLSKIFSEKIIEVKKNVLQKKANTTATTLNALVEKNIFEIYEKKTGRVNYSTQFSNEKTILNEIQTEAFGKIKNLFSKKI